MAWNRGKAGMHGDRRMSVTDSLATAVLGADYATPRKARKPVQRGPKPADAPRRSRPAIKEPDELLLEVRRLREQAGFSIGQIREHARHLGFELSADRAYSICNYTTRAHLIPAAGAPPYLEKAAP